MCICFKHVSTVFSVFGSIWNCAFEKFAIKPVRIQIKQSCIEVVSTFHELRKICDKSRLVIKRRCSRNRLNYLMKFFSLSHSLILFTRLKRIVQYLIRLSYKRLTFLPKISFNNAYYLQVESSNFKSAWHYTLIYFKQLVLYCRLKSYYKFLLSLL